MVNGASFLSQSPWTSVDFLRRGEIIGLLGESAFDYYENHIFSLEWPLSFNKILFW